MNTASKHNGYTLIELIVVMALLSIILFVSVPRFRNTVLTDPAKQASRWIIGTVGTLKERAVQDQMRYALTVDIGANRLLVSAASRPEDSTAAEKRIEYQVPDGARMLDVEFPGKGKISSGQADILFYQRGYSDKAFIHIENDAGERRTLLIEPFLSHVILYDHYVDFEN